MVNIMGDATLPPPPSSSSAPAAEDGKRSESSNGKLESDSSVIEYADATLKEEESGEGKSDKQKRKRTR
jgi:hypothetical protein